MSKNVQQIVERALNEGRARATLEASRRQYEANIAAIRRVHEQRPAVIDLREKVPA